MARLGAALSGGGHLAGLFGLGVLLYLADAEKNREVTSISSVSGGSITNGFVAQETDYQRIGAEEFHQAVAPLARRLGETGTLMRTTPSPRQRILLLATLLPTAIVWLLPWSRWARFGLFLAAVAIWAVVLLAPLFVTVLGRAFGVIGVVTLFAFAIAPWIVPLPDGIDVAFARFGLFAAAVVVWSGLVWSRRGVVCAHAFKQTLFSGGDAAAGKSSPSLRDPTLLREISRGIDHVICATDLQTGEQVYFSADFIYAYRFGKGKPGDLLLATAVQSSANLPFAFPPRWLPTKGHDFAHLTKDCPKAEHRLSPVPSHMVLTDGGVYDNMADQWAQGFGGRTECWPSLAEEHHEPQTLIVVNASEGLGWRSFKRSRIPALGGLLALLKVKDILYDQTTAQRRSGLVGRFDRAALSGVGMQGALVHIPQSPFDVAERFVNSTEWPDRARRAGEVLAWLGKTETEWAAIAEEDAAMPTVLSAHGRSDSARLLRHAYALATANLHVILDFPLLELPPASWFEALVGGKAQSREPAAVSAPSPDEEALTKVQPKLRMFANGSTEVNAVRARLCSSLAVTKEVRKEFAERSDTPDIPIPPSALPSDARGSLQEPPRAKAHVFMELVEDLPGPVQLLVGQSARRAGLAAATVPLAEIRAIAARPEVRRIEAGEILSAPLPEISRDPSSPPSHSDRRLGSADVHRDGKGVLVGIVDVGGFDFAHPDFRDEDGGTRFVRIWDQGGQTRPPPDAPGSGGFVYGSEFTKKQLDGAIRDQARAGAPAADLEPQSQMEEGAHGTHVASIAAGNHGICPKAFIAGVLVSLDPDEADRRKTFSDSTRIAHAVDYLLRVAEDLREEHHLEEVPVSINISLGTNGHAHDGTSAASRWIDGALSVPGRSVCVAAGNAGQHMPEFANDTGWIMGRIHTFKRLERPGDEVDLEWVVVGNGKSDVSENELELWYSPQDRFAVSLRSPDGEWTPVVEPGQFIENRELHNRTFVSVYNELYHPANGSNYLAAYLSPFYKAQGKVGVASGTWLLRVHAREVRDGSFHAWIERDDPRRLGRIGDAEAWRFPSFFSQDSVVDTSSVSSLACGRNILSVANLDETTSTINVSSSQGPTRDARHKPDVAAPGTNIVAAKAFAPGEGWISMTGTSMASPFVTGTVGLMLATEPRLTAAQIGGIVQRTARPLAGAGPAWLDDAGFGVIDPEACVSEAANVNDRRDLFP